MKLLKYILGKKEQASRPYKDFSPNDLMLNESFKKWAKEEGGDSVFFWEKWVEGHPEKRERIAQMKQVINAIDYKEKAHISNKEYVDIYEQVMSRSPEKVEAKRVSIRLAWFMKVAALLLLVLGVTYFFQEWGSKPALVTATDGENVEMLTKECPSGSKITLGLKDGSMVKLNSGSKLTYPSEFADSIREVTIEGEAFFQIKEEAQRPFIVNTKGVRLKVLGTSFNVNNQGGRNEVALVTGKLLVSNKKGDTLQLSPSEMATLKEGDEMVKTNFDIELVTAWEKGVLLFRNKKYKEVFNTLERWYGVEIVVEEGTALKGTYTGKYDNEYLENVLEGIARVSGFQYEITEDKVQIKPIGK